MIWILIKVGLFITAIFLSMYVLKALMTRIFKIEVDEKSSSQGFVNAAHEQVDRRVKNISFVVLLIVFIVIVVYFEEAFTLFVFAVFLSTFFRMLIRAFFQWKHSKYPKQAILTLTEMFVLLLAVIVFVQSNLFF